MKEHSSWLFRWWLRASRAHVLKLVVLIVFVGVVSSLFVSLPHGEPGSPPYLTVFLIDGLNSSVFTSELAAGRLPNVARLIKEGSYAPNTVGSFPSVTGYAFYPLFTGRDSVSSGVNGLR